MQFTKTLSKKKKKIGIGYCKITNNEITIFINDGFKQIDEIGFIEGGIGCVLSGRRLKAKTPYTQAQRKYEKEDMPANLRATGYSFRIPATKMNENEFTFMFKDAFML